MTEPKDEMFAAADFIKKERESKDAEAKERQRLIDQKRADDAKQSHERAVVLVEILLEYQDKAPTTEIHSNYSTKVVGYRDRTDYEKMRWPNSTSKPEVSGIVVSSNDVVGEGWVIVPDVKAQRDTENSSAVSADPGIFLMKDSSMVMYFSALKDGYNKDQADETFPIIGTVQNPGKRYGAKPIFAGEAGLRLIGRLIDGYGISSEKSISKDTQ
jgi:hypothetical protein